MFVASTQISNISYYSVKCLFKTEFMHVGVYLHSSVGGIPFVNGLCHPNVFGFPKCTLRSLTPSNRINKKQLKFFRLFSFLDFKFDVGLSGSPNPNRNPILTVPLAGFPLRLNSNLTTSRFSLLL